MDWGRVLTKRVNVQRAAVVCCGATRSTRLRWGSANSGHFLARSKRQGLSRWQPFLATAEAGFPILLIGRCVLFLDTVKVLGLSAPLSLLARADKVIE